MHLHPALQLQAPGKNINNSRVFTGASGVGRRGREEERAREGGRVEEVAAGFATRAGDLRGGRAPDQS